MTARPTRFPDRRSAGQLLGDRLRQLEIEAPLVVGLPRGGVPVAYEVARAVDAQLDIALVRKLGAPRQPELGIGAIGEDGTVVLDAETIVALDVGRGEIEAIVRREKAELERQRKLYRGDEPAADVTGRTVILVDDGLATGVTATAATQVLAARGAEQVVVAVPVCPRFTIGHLRDQLGTIVCLETPLRFGGVGAWYDDFAQTTDDEVIELLQSRR